MTDALKDAYRTMAADQDRYYVVEHGASVVAGMDGGAFVAVTFPDDSWGMDDQSIKNFWVYVAAIPDPQDDGH